MVNTDAREPTRARAGGSLYEYYFTDHLGSTRALYDGTDDLTAAYDYTPYGAMFASQNRDATTHLYTGHDLDPAATLYFAPYRYYGPDIARWTTPDPLGLIAGPNLYGYVDGDPVGRFDPDGRIGFLAVLGFFAGGIAIGGTLWFMKDLGDAAEDALEKNKEWEPNRGTPEGEQIRLDRCEDFMKEDMQDVFEKVRDQYEAYPLPPGWDPPGMDPWDWFNLDKTCPLKKYGPGTTVPCPEPPNNPYA